MVGIGADDGEVQEGSESLAMAEAIEMAWLSRREGRKGSLKENEGRCLIK